MMVNNCLQEEMHCKNLGSNKKQMFDQQYHDERKECKRYECGLNNLL